MKILLIDIDSRIPNYALAKIEKYHLDRGDDVERNMPIMRSWADKVYVSCIFTQSRIKAEEYFGAEIGGTGWDLLTVLPDEIERIKPRINLGFTTRGCIRNCDFCVVPRKEGKIRAVGSLLDLWDGKSKDVTLLDNNILALKDHFKSVCKDAKDNNIRLDFNQGLDFRLLSDEVIKSIKSIRHKELRFSYDDISYEPKVIEAIDLLKYYGIKKSFWYVLVGFNSTIENDIVRLELLRKHGQNAYVQRYHTVYSERKYVKIAQWANQHHIFAKIGFDEFINKRYAGVF